jgi:hypothetical protein
MALHAYVRNNHTAATPPLHQLPYRSVKSTSLTAVPNDSLNIIEAELISILARRNNPKIVAQGVFLEELFCKILQVSLRKGDVGTNRDSILICSRGQRNCVIRGSIDATDYHA